MNKYQIIDVIDQGAYGIVLKAINKQTNRLVAIKKFKELQKDQITKRNIQREIKMLKILRSEYVVQLLQAFKKKGRAYLIFQHMQKNILNLIDASVGGLHSDLIKQIIYQIIKALDFLHTKNIVHRDIKPQNLLVSKSQSGFHLKICDFGFARYLPFDQDQSLTDYIATRWYRAPELLLGQKYGKPMDIWAVGCIMGELIDGQPMFPGDDEVDQMNLIRKIFGKISQNQQQVLKNNQRYSQVIFPQIKFIEPLEMKYAGRINKLQLNFLKSCLKLNPNERITTQDALNHPYFDSLIQFEKLKTEQFARVTVKKSLAELKSQSLSKILTRNEESTEKISINQIKTKIKASMPQIDNHKQSKMKDFLRDKIDKQVNKMKYINISKQSVKDNLNNSIKLNMNVNLNVNLSIGKDNSLPKLKSKQQVGLNNNNKSNSQAMILLNKFKSKQLNTIYNQQFDFEIIGKSQTITRRRYPKI